MFHGYGARAIRAGMVAACALFSLAPTSGPAQAQNTECPTAPNGTNDNRCASTAFVQNAILGGASGITINTTPLSGGTNGDCLIVNGSGPATVGQTVCGTASITSLTGDVTGTGPGATATTLATVNSAPGSVGSSTAIPVLTINGKGLVTAQSSAVVIAPAGTLTGTTLNSTVVTSSLTSVGTIGTGTWQGTAIGLSFIASIAADNVLGNPTGGSLAPQAMAVNDCHAAQNALTYNTSTHVFGCNAISGSGTVNTGTAGQLVYYPGSTNVVGGNVNANISAGALTLGVANTTIGQLILEGNTSGAVTITPQAVAGAPTLTLPNTSGTIAAGVANGTNVTLTLSATTGVITAGWQSQLSLANGGTAASLTASNGGIFYSTGAAGAILAGTATARQMLQSGATAAPAWSTAVWPATAAAGTMLTAATANTITASAAPTLGAIGGTTGALNLSGATSGTVTVTVNDAAGTWTAKLPTSVGSAGQFLSTDGGTPALLAWANPAGGGTVNAGTAGQMTYYATSSAAVSGNTNANISAGALTLGTANTTIGQVILEGSTSGAVTLTPRATAGTPTVTFGTSSGTPAVTATAPLAISATTGNITCTNCAATIIQPQGRATLVTGVPVMSSTSCGGGQCSAQTSIFYVCYNGGNAVPYYTGTADTLDTIGSCSVSTAMSSASVASQIGASGVFDVWWEGNTNHNICIATNGTGGGWASDVGGTSNGSNTARAVGTAVAPSGYSQLDTTTRPYITNAKAVTHCYNGTTDYGSINANRLTYLGTVVTDSSAGKVSFTFPTTGNPPTAGAFNVFNAYNRVLVIGEMSDTITGTGWNYTPGVANAWRSAHNLGLTVNYAAGVADNAIDAEYFGMAQPGAAGALCTNGVGIDSTTAASGGFGMGIGNSVGQALPSFGKFVGTPGVGSHFAAPIESNNNTTNFCQFYGALYAGSQTGFFISLRM